MLFWLGWLATIKKVFQKSLQLQLTIIVCLGFLSFFVAHSIFWHFGIFNSMGLKRVLLCMSPFITILSLLGLNFALKISIFKSIKIKHIFLSLLTVAIVLFPFTDNPAAIHWNKELRKTDDQISANRVAKYIQRKKLMTQKMHYYHPYLNIALGIDPFDETKHILLSDHSIQEMKAGELYIWDKWFAATEAHTPLNTLLVNNSFERLYSSNENDSTQELHFVVFRKK
jgi:hypothetical protein